MNINIDIRRLTDSTDKEIFYGRSSLEEDRENFGRTAMANIYIGSSDLDVVYACMGRPTKRPVYVAKEYNATAVIEIAASKNQRLSTSKGTPEVSATLLPLPVIEGFPHAGFQVLRDGTHIGLVANKDAQTRL